MTCRPFVPISLALLIGLFAHASAFSQPNRNGIARSLPMKFQGLSNDQAREAGLLAELCILWIGDIREVPGADPVVDLFGPFGGQRPDADEDDAGAPIPADENERGLVVLSGFTRAQLNDLYAVVKDQKESLRAYYLARAKLISKMRQLRDREEKETAADARTFDKEFIELGKAMGEAEAKVAVTQAWAFVQFEAKFSESQRDYFRLFRQDPSAYKLDSPAVKTIRQMLAGLEEPYPLLMQDLAAKMASYLSASAEQNVARRPPRATTLLGKTSPRFPDSARQFIERLNAAQQDKMIGLLSAERPYTSDYVKKRVEFIVALDGLKKAQKLDDKKFILAGAQMGELEARVALAQARTFEQIRLTLSPSQQFFIDQNLVPPQPSLR